MRFAVTTGRDEKRAASEAARAFATRHGLPFVVRRGRNLKALLAQEPVELLIVVAGDGVTLMDRAGTPLRFHAGMAEVRAKRVANGEHDPVVALLESRAGDVVLDGTFGLGRDALVIASSGAKVVGLESVGLLAAFAQEGLRFLPGQGGAAAGRVQVVHARLEAHLAGLAPGSIDAVFLDPMFGEEVSMAPDFELFRTLADPSPISRETVQRACVVARRWVVLKDGPRAAWIKGLDLPLETLTFGNRVRFGRLRGGVAPP